MHPDENKDMLESLLDEEMITRIKALRVAIDHCIKNAQHLANIACIGAGAHELSTCVDKLREGKMWAGQSQGELGHTLPEQYRDEA
jgi:hypothetical protein